MRLYVTSHQKSYPRLLNFNHMDLQLHVSMRTVQMTPNFGTYDPFIFVLCFADDLGP